MHSLCSAFVHAIAKRRARRSGSCGSSDVQLDGTAVAHPLFTCRFGSPQPPLSISHSELLHRRRRFQYRHLLASCHQDTSIGSYPRSSSTWPCHYTQPLACLQSGTRLHRKGELDSLVVFKTIPVGGGDNDVKRRLLDKAGKSGALPVVRHRQLQTSQHRHRRPRVTVESITASGPPLQCSRAWPLQLQAPAQRILKLW